MRKISLAANYYSGSALNRLASSCQSKKGHEVGRQLTAVQQRHRNPNEKTPIESASPKLACDRIQ
jgi:hypothetical protein